MEQATFALLASSHTLEAQLAAELTLEAQLAAELTLEAQLAAELTVIGSHKRERIPTMADLESPT